MEWGVGSMDGIGDMDGGDINDIKWGGDITGAEV